MTELPVTEQGRATRDRIVRAAAQLIAERGAAATSLDDVRALTAASKSQLYHYFGGKHGLVAAVVDHQCAAVLDLQLRALGAVEDWDGLERWRDLMVALVAEHGGRGGCPIGTLAAALADTDEPLRVTLDAAFERWSEAIRGALARLRDNGLIAADADLERLTTTTLAAVEGGLLLSKTSRDPGRLRVALDGVLAQLGAHAPAGARRNGPSQRAGRLALESST